MLRELRLLLTELPREFTLALAAFAPVRLQEPFDFKRMIERLLKAVSFSLPAKIRRFVAFADWLVVTQSTEHNLL